MFSRTVEAEAALEQYLTSAGNPPPEEIIAGYGKWNVKGELLVGLGRAECCDGA